MNTRDASHVFCLVLQVFIGGFFLVTGVSKAIDPLGFAGEIANYRIVTGWLTLATAHYLPWLEIVAGAGLFVRRIRTGALLVCGGLLLVFTAALVATCARGLDIRCGCIGGVPTTVPLALLRNAILLAACGAIVRIWSRKKH